LPIAIEFYRRESKEICQSSIQDVVSCLFTFESAERDRGAELRHLRDRAIVLLGFWRGFRGDELVRLLAEHVEIVPGEGLTCYFSQTKGDRTYRGTSYKAPALARLYPVEAYAAWVNAAQVTAGLVFRAIDRWGHISDVALHADSLVPLLRSILVETGIVSADLYSGHSLRRGFANWATSNGWDLKTLMEYVGWKNVQSAMRYVNAADPFADQRRELRVGYDRASED
jgi:integrase